MSDSPGYLHIREAAIALFAERGADGTSILDIAEVAGVSGGLIRHHFGSKDQLREACDRHVFAEIRRFKAAEIARLLADPTYLPAYDERILRYYRYLGRATMDGSPQARRQFERVVDETEQWLVTESGQEYDDPRAVAAVMTAQSTGTMAMLDTIASTLAMAPGTADLMQRVGAAIALLYARPMLAPDLAHRFTAMANQVAADALQQGHPAADHPPREER